MSARLFLIAEREFRTYVATLSFWVALAIGPLILVAAIAMAGRDQSPVPIHLVCANVELCRHAMSALVDTAKLENHRVKFGDGSAATIWVALGTARTIDVTFENNFPLTPAGRAYVALRIERDASPNIPASGASVVVRNYAATTSSSTIDAARISRFALVLVLWLTLTGSLGMLLQTIVRERSNRALESLLAVVSPWEIATGKVLGVGVISMLVLLVWLGSAGGMAAFVPGRVSAALPLLSAFASPVLLARALLIYLFAYALYGFTTIAIGAAARDTASAQNLSRPMFVVLLTAFFVSLASATSAEVDLSWLVYVPPFAPFILLLKGPGEYTPVAELSALALLVICTAFAARLAVSRITIGGDVWSSTVLRRLRAGLSG